MWRHLSIHLFPLGLRRATDIMVLLALFPCGLCGVLKAQPQHFTVAGNTYIPSSAILNWFRLLRPDTASLKVQSAYAARGFLDATVALDSGGLITIGEGLRYVVDSVELVVQGPASSDPALRGAFSAEALKGDYFDSDRIDAFMLAQVLALNSAGYPLARVRLTEAEPQSNSGKVRLRISLEPGDRVRIAQVLINGNTQTRDDLILTAAAIPEDAVFTDDLAQSVKARLRRLNVFSEVAEPQLYKKDDTAYGLLLNVTEGQANSFDGIIGYQPAAQPGQSGTLTGLLNIALRNLFGSGRRLSVRWSRQTQSAQELEVRYGEPFLFGLPLDLDIGFRQHQESATAFLVSYVMRNLHADLYYGLTPAVYLRAGLALDQTIPQSDTTLPCQRQYLNTSTLDLTIGLQYDTRSNPYNPVSGARASAWYTIGNKKLNGPLPCLPANTARADTRRRTEFDLEAYVPVSRALVLSGGLHGGDVTGGITDDADLFTFGGQATVRGYRENLIRASRRAWGTLEPRLLLSGLSYVSVFLDAGYYQRPVTQTTTTAQEEFIYGYGLGLQVETPAGLARVSFALGKGETFDTGKIFIGIAATF